MQMAVSQDFIFMLKVVFYFIQMASTAQFSKFEIEICACSKSFGISSEFGEVFTYANDVMTIFKHVLAKPDKFVDFINSATDDGDDVAGIWLLGPGQKSLVIMALTAFGTAWEMLMTTVKTKHGDREMNAVSELYGVVLSCFIEDGITYSIDGKTQPKEVAERECAAQFRNAVAHCRMMIEEKASPWTMAFNIDYQKKKLSLQLTPRGLYSFLSLFINFSRFDNITKDSITAMLKVHISKGECFRPQKLLDFVSKQ